MSRMHYASELDAVRVSLSGMGRTTIALLGDALSAIVELAPQALERARQLEATTDEQHRAIHDQCVNLITRQAPVARDARMITGALDAIVDLELIADYAYEIVGLAAAMPRKPPAAIATQLAQIGGKIQSALIVATEAWEGAVAVNPEEMRGQASAIRSENRLIYEKLSQLSAAPADTTVYFDLMLVCRHLDRILRHTVCVAEQAASAAPLEPVGMTGR